MGYFTVKSKKKLEDLEIGSRLEESDFAQLTNNGTFVQLEHHDEEVIHYYDVKPGIWAVSKTKEGLGLVPTSFVSDNILEEFVSTKEIEEAIDCFFRNLHLYTEFGIEVPKRGIFLYGPPGGGKSTAIGKVANKYVTDNKTAIVIWHTAKWEAYQIKDLFKSFKYTGVEKLILIAEDLGGAEANVNASVPSDSSLLSLLDNQEKTFTIPVCIIATTNYPHMFLGNLTNRSGRFDDKIEVDFPPAEARVKLLNFFSKNTATSEEQEIIKSDKCKEFVPATIREVYIRSRLRSKSMLHVIKEMIKEQELFKKDFVKNTRNMGF